MTWKLVTIRPSLSQTKPDPVPYSVCRALRLEMCTTEGETLRNRLIVDFSSSARSPRAVTTRGSAFASIPPRLLDQYHHANAPTGTPSRQRKNTTASHDEPV